MCKPGGRSSSSDFWPADDDDQPANAEHNPHARGWTLKDFDNRRGWIYGPQLVMKQDGATGFHRLKERGSGALPTAPERYQKGFGAPGPRRRGRGCGKRRGSQECRGLAARMRRRVDG